MISLIIIFYWSFLKIWYTMKWRFFMKIIIVGAGKVGEYLFTDLNTEDNDIILIEKKQDILNENVI